MKSNTRTAGTDKLRRDVLGGKRGDGHAMQRRGRRVRRADPSAIRVGVADPSLTGVAGLVPFGVFLRRIGLDAQLERAFGGVKVGRAVVYSMGTQMRLLIDANAVGEQRVFGLEGLASDPLFVKLAGGTVPSIDTVYRDLARMDELENAKLELVMADHGLATLAQVRGPTVHCDLDTTVEPVFGEQAGALDFQRGAWREAKRRFRVVAVRRSDRDTGKQVQLWQHLEYGVQVFITNDHASDAADVVAEYDGRAEIEPRIAELKNGVGIGKVPTKDFHANHAMLLLEFLTHNLVRRFATEHAPDLVWRTPWLVRALFRVPGRLTRSGRQCRLHTHPASRVNTLQRMLC
jgi:Transposase DDE domain group 1